ncbi:MAG TPA: hypothetical protein VNV87_03680 [Acidimicrobiales bacterium]|jgi:hypothetical protein|nr:hypothetical protein [Acidimicrobiales bacterium]
MTPVVVDDHLLRDVLASERSSDLGGIAPDGIATTGFWVFRLCASLERPTVAGKLSSPVAALPKNLQARFRSQVAALPEEIQVLPLRELAWTMAELQNRHRLEGRILSAAMVEALAAAHRLDAAIAVSANDVGPNLRASADADGVPFHIL